jgi:hypothetical protein
MIAIEISDPDLKKATAENHSGEWWFLMPDAKTFTATGPWKDARSKAEAHARACGSIDGQDSICSLVLFGETK